MIRISRLALAGALTMATGLAVSFPAAGGALPFSVRHRIEISGGAPVTALAFAPDGKLAFAAVGDVLRSFIVATGLPGAVVKAAGPVTALAASAGTSGSVYAAVGAPARLMLLDTHPLRVRSSVALRAGAPSGMLYEPGEHSLYVESRSGHSVARLDAADGKTIAVARLPGDLAQMAGDDRGTLYVADAAGNAVDVIATGKMALMGAIPTPDCDAPTGLDLDPVGRRLFVACGNGTALVIDTDMGFAFEQLPIARGAAPRAAFAFHPGGGWKGGTFIAGGEPVLDAIRMNAFISYSVGGSMPLPGRATALAASAAAAQVWIAVAPRSGAPDSAGAAKTAQRPQGVEILALAGRGDQ